MKRLSVTAIIMVIVMLLPILGGCSKNKDNDPVISVKPIEEGGTGQGTGDGAAATATPTTAPTNTPSPTPEPVTDTISSTVLSDPEAAEWLGLKTPESIKAANIYDLFLKGETKVSVNDDFAYLPKGEYDIKSLVNKMAEQLQNDYMPNLLSKARYTLLDCGADGFPELALELVYSEDSPYGSDATEYVIIKAVDDKLAVIDCEQNYYRSYAQINRYGIIESGGSFGVSSSEHETRIISADGKTEIYFILDYYGALQEPVIPGTILPQEMYDALNSFEGTMTGDGTYSMDIWSVNGFESSDDSQNAMDAAYKEYMQNAIFAFSGDDGEYILPDEKYVKACADVGLRICANAEWDEMIEARRKKLGITDEMFEGDDPVWFTVKSLESELKASQTGTGSTGSSTTHPYSDFLGTWYLMRGEVEGYVWTAEEETYIQYLTFNEDYTAVRRRDFDSEWSNYDEGACNYYVRDDGTAVVSVHFDDEGEIEDFVFSINDNGVLTEDGTVDYGDGTYAGVYREYERKPFWGEGGYYFEVTAPVTPDAVKEYINKAKDNEWLVVLADPSDSIKKACDEGRWEVNDETDNQWIDCEWKNAKELIVANASDMVLEIEVHEPKEGYDTKSSDTAWEAGPFFYWASLKPGELYRMIVDMPDSPKDATMCLYINKEGEEDNKYYIRIYKYDQDDPYLAF